uniref:Purple acid phosphatase n=1 Tax=Biomphalaria glabrata TaxID=6526 RepID=A0A2C9K5Q5_BIOGL
MQKNAEFEAMHCVFLCMLMSMILITHICNTEVSEEFMPFETATIQDQNLCKPQHVHISFGDSINEVNIVWSTFGFCVCLVRYGTDPWRYEFRADANHTYFTTLNSRGLKHLYRVNLKGLHSAARYYYQIENDESTAGPFYFQVPPEGKDWSPDFLIFGDLGIHADTINFLVNEALSGHYTALIHAGDLAYDMKDKEGLVGDYFMKEIEPMAAYIPYLTCPGNHEIDFGTFSHYRNRFSMPNTDWPIPIDKMWYSIDIGPVHVISYSSEVFFTNSGKHIEAQRRWLIENLRNANNNRKTTPWIIAFGHRPLYCSTKINDDCSLLSSEVRNGLEDIFTLLGVDLIIQAHEHNYERLWPLYQWNVLNYSYVNPDVPVQIITGAAGSIEGIDNFESYYHPNWSAFRLDSNAFNSYGRLLVVNHSHLFWEQRSINNHTTLDSIWIVKERPGPESTTVPVTSRTYHGTKITTSTYVIALSISLGILLAVILLLFILRQFFRARRIKLFLSQCRPEDSWPVPYSNFSSPEEEENL